MCYSRTAELKHVTVLTTFCDGVNCTKVEKYRIEQNVQKKMLARHKFHEYLYLWMEKNIEEMCNVPSLQRMVSKYSNESHTSLWWNIFLVHDGTEYGHHILYVICEMEHEIYISTYNMCDHFTLITWNIS
jgi:hypothetical protein